MSIWAAIAGASNAYLSKREKDEEQKRLEEKEKLRQKLEMEKEQRQAAREDIRYQRQAEAQQARDERQAETDRLNRMAREDERKSNEAYRNRQLAGQEADRAARREETSLYRTMQENNRLEQDARSALSDFERSSTYKNEQGAYVPYDETSARLAVEEYNRLMRERKFREAMDVLNQARAALMGKRGSASYSTQQTPSDALFIR